MGTGRDDGDSCPENLPKKKQQRRGKFSGKITGKLPVCRRLAYSSLLKMEQFKAASEASMRANKGYQDWLKAQPIVKKQMPPGACAALLGWVKEGRDSDDIAHSTFQYIAMLVDEGKEHSRLAVAALDFGYTRDELLQLKQQGKTGKDIAREVLARGVDLSD